MKLKSEKIIPLEKDNSIVDSIIYRIEPDFVLTLMSKFKSLSEDELKICVLIKNDFSNAEIGRFMELREGEIPLRVKKIQRKLMINKDNNIKNYLQNYNKSK